MHKWIYCVSLKSNDFCFWQPHHASTTSEPREQTSLVMLRFIQCGQTITLNKSLPIDYFFRFYQKIITKIRAVWSRVFLPPWSSGGMTTAAWCGGMGRSWGYESTLVAWCGGMEAACMGHDCDVGASWPREALSTHELTISSIKTVNSTHIESNLFLQ